MLAALRVNKKYGYAAFAAAGTAIISTCKVDRSVAANKSATEIDAQLSSSANSYPPFSLDQPSRFDLSTYSGRARHFIDTLGDLSTLFATEAEVQRHKALIQAFKQDGSRCGSSDAELWHARTVVEATCHPETGEMIPPPVRFSAFAPANLLICAGMLRPNPTLLQSAFWQWVNQSYNACVNHYNRSSAGPRDVIDAGGDGRGGDRRSSSSGTFAQAYGAATSSALAICLGLQEGARRLSGGSARVASFVRLTVPMLAVSVSANVNLLMVRSSELTDGVPVVSDSGEPLGSSLVAARRGLIECAATRVLWTFMLLTATPVCASAAFGVLPQRLMASQAARLGVELGVSFGVIWLSVPLAIAAFPQREQISVAELEDDLRARWRTHAGAEMDESRAVVWFNRGL